MPKSRSLIRSPPATSSSGVTIRFSGFRSRWMMPASWMAATAEAIRRSIGSALASAMPPDMRSMRARNTSPATSSIAIHGPWSGESP
jgi:hypothetical protein